jgi:uridine kinase
MEGDILIIGEKHRKAARQAYHFIKEELRNTKSTYFITVAGESGAGKSETAAALAEVIENAGYKVFIVQQDDFFIFPPKTNAARRVETGGKVGPEEVRLNLMNEIIKSIKSGNTTITKPLVIFDEDRITEEKVDISGYTVIILEGTYTTLLDNIDCKVFIDRNLEDTKADRLKRNREKQDEFLEKILLTEHRIISGHKPLADITITTDFDAIK